MSPIARAVRERDGNETKDEAELEESEDHQQSRAGFHASNMDDGEHQDGADTCEASAKRAESDDEAEILGEAGGERCRNARIHDKKALPAVEECHSGSIRLAEIDVPSPGARKARSQCAEAQRAGDGHG